MNLIRRIHNALTNSGTITFCDRCGQVCDASCRANAVRGRASSTTLLRHRH